MSAPPAYDAVRITATVPLRKHLWDVGRFWPAWEESGENAVRQLGQPRKCNKEVMRAITTGRSGALKIAPVDLMAEYILHDEYVPEKGANRRDEHIVDDAFRAVTKGLLYKDAPTLSSTHPAASERIETHAERRSFLRARCADPVLDPLALISRQVVAGGSAALAAAAAARDASIPGRAVTIHISGAESSGTGGAATAAGTLGACAQSSARLGHTTGTDTEGCEGRGGSLTPEGGFALCLAVRYDALRGEYTVWLPPTPRYPELTDEAYVALPSPLPPHTCAVGTIVSVPATMLRAHDVRANLFRDYFKGQEVLARRIIDGLPETYDAAAGGATLSPPLGIYLS
jgi:hypothetical protein